MKYTKKQRQEAIEALEICASNLATYIEGVADDDIVYELAYAAFAIIPDFIDRDTILFRSVTADYLEASALLRDGWEPGDPIYWLKTGEVVQ